MAENDSNVEAGSDGNGTPKPIAKSMARVIDNIVDSWFAKPKEGWRLRSRFWCAFAGSGTFFFSSILFPNLTEPNPIIWDPEFRVTNLLSFCLRSGLAAWFAWLVSWKDMGHGPARLYLSGLLLPSFVSFILAGAFSLLLD